MNFILTDGNERQVTNYARGRIINFFEQGIKDSVVFCLGENKQGIETNIRRYVDAVSKELIARGFTVNPKVYSQVRKFHVQTFSERLDCMPVAQAALSDRNYDVMKMTMGAGHDGIPSLFVSFYPVDSENIDGGYVQPDMTIRVPLIFGNSSVFRYRSENKAAVTQFGINLMTLDAVRTHMSRAIEVPVPLSIPAAVVEDDDAVPMIEEPVMEDTDEDVIPQDINHAATVVDTIRQQSKHDRLQYAQT